jgi:DNA-binding NtrC family response regulator
VRELRNVIERAVILAPGSTIEEHHLVIRPVAGHEGSPQGHFAPKVESLESMEKRLICRVLEQTNWQKARSAEILGINRTTLWQKIKRYGLRRSA